MLRRTPLKRTPLARGNKALGRGKGLNAKSAKRAAEDVPGGPRDQVRQATFERDDHRCVAADFVPDVPCWAGSVECDEIQGRGRQPGSHLDDTATQTLCRICHLLKTDHPRMAGLLGLYGGAEWLRRIGDLPEHVSGKKALQHALDEWATRKATALGLPLVPPQPLDGVTALIRSRIAATVSDPRYGDGDAPGLGG